MMREEEYQYPDFQTLVAERAKIILNDRYEWSARDRVFRGQVMRVTLAARPALMCYSTLVCVPTSSAS